MPTVKPYDSEAAFIDHITQQLKQVAKIKGDKLGTYINEKGASWNKAMIGDFWLYFKLFLQLKAHLRQTERRSYYQKSLGLFARHSFNSWSNDQCFIMTFLLLL